VSPRTKTKGKRKEKNEEEQKEKVHGQDGEKGQKQEKKQKDNTEEEIKLEEDEEEIVEDERKMSSNENKGKKNKNIGDPEKKKTILNKGNLQEKSKHKSAPVNNKHSASSQAITHKLKSIEEIHNTPSALLICDTPVEENKKMEMPVMLAQTKKSKLMSLSSPVIQLPIKTKAKTERSDLSIFRNFGKKKKEEKPVAKANIYLANNFSELPDDMKRKIQALKMDEDQINQHWEHFVYILRHVTKDSYRIPDMAIPRSERYPNVSEELRKSANDSIIMIEKHKDIKKIYKFIETSGKGGFGRVCCAREKETKTIVAIKRLPATTSKEEVANASEIACLIALRHPNVVDYKSSYFWNNELWIVTEYMEGGTLCQAIKVHALSEPHIAYITKQLLTGLAYIHSKGFAHRDLKSNNIMMSVSGNIKLIDFGLCADLSKGPRVQMLGTAYWMAPEMIKRLPHDTKADIWSLGIVILEMYLRGPPYSSSRILCMFKAVCGETADCLNTTKVTICDAARSIVSRCLVADPNDRPTAEDLLTHDFVENTTLDKELTVVLKTIFVSITLFKSGI